MAHVSADYTVTNQLPAALVLRKAELQGGEWSESGPPAQRVEPGATVSWRSNSELLGDAAGKVVYGVDGIPSRSVRFSWNVPAAGANEFAQQGSSPSIAITRSLEAKSHSHPHMTHVVQDAVEPWLSPPRTPALAGRADDRLDLFVYYDDRVLHTTHAYPWKHYARADWTKWWTSLDRPSTGVSDGLSAAWISDKELVVIAVDDSGHAVARTCSDGTWGDWAQWGGKELVGTVGIATRGDEVLLAARDARGDVWLRARTSGAWSDWRLVGEMGRSATSPQVVAARRRDDQGALNDEWHVHHVGPNGTAVREILSGPAQSPTWVSLESSTGPGPLGDVGVAAGVEPSTPTRTIVVYQHDDHFVARTIDDDAGTDEWRELELPALTGPALAWGMPWDMHVITADVEHVVRHQRWVDRTWFEPEASVSPRSQHFWSSTVPVHEEALAVSYDLSWHDGASKARFGGEMRATGIWDYRVQLGVLLRSVSQPAGIAFHHATEGGNQPENWDEEIDVPALADLDYARFDVEDECRTREKYAELVDDALDFLGGIIVAPIVIGVTAVVAVFAAGLELLGLVEEGTAKGVLKVGEAVMAKAGPAGFIGAAALGLVSSIGEETSRLSQEDYDYCNVHVFGGTLPDRNLLFVTDSSRHSDGPAGWRAYTFPAAGGHIEINMGPAQADPKSAEVVHGEAPYQTLVHELVHVWQIDRKQSITLLADLWEAQVAATGNAYDFGTAAGKEWEDLNLEQQASVVEHWFIGKTAYNLAGPDVLPMSEANPLFRFVRDRIRTPV